MSQKKNKPKVVKKYNYRDRKGNIVLQVCRTDPKDFFQRQPDGKDGWKYTTKGVEPVPYDLPLILSADPYEPIYIPAGEKDCETLKKQGKIATTNYGGERNWRPELNKYFSGRDVIILPDNDDTGRKHAEKVAKSVSRVAASVKVVTIPGLPDKGDVSDYFAHGGTVEALDEIVQSTKEWQDKSSKGKRNGQDGSKSEKESPFSASFPGLVDLVANDQGSVAFLIKEKDGLVIQADPLADHLPPPKEQLPYLLPRGTEAVRYYQDWLDDPVAANAKLFEDLVLYHQNISELPDKRHYVLLAAWDMHTYLQEHFRYSPEICFFAVAERGKTRTGRGMINVAYRGIRLVSLREAYIFRLAENLNASLFFDIMDAWQVARENSCQDILLNRFEKGSRVPRVLWPEKGAFQDTKYYEVFGPTIIGTNTALNQILDTRAITITMHESKKRYANEIEEKDAQPYRERLLAFRSHYLNQPLPEVEKPVGGRLGDITRPLRQIIHLVKPEAEESFLSLCQELKQGSVEDKAETVEGQIVKIILNSENRVEDGILPIKAVTDQYNEGKQQRFQTTPQRIGRILKSLGFHPGKHRPKMPDGAAAISWNEKFINRLAESYGLRESSETSEISESSEITGLSDVSDEQEPPLYSDDPNRSPCAHARWSKIYGREGVLKCETCRSIWNYGKGGEEI